MPNDPFYQSSEWRKARASRLQLDSHCCTVPGCHAAALVVDHCNPAKPRSLDPRDLRSLCRLHDNQVKEGANGTRRSGGQFKIIGTDSDGWPLDPKRR